MAFDVTNASKIKQGDPKENMFSVLMAGKGTKDVFSAMYGVKGSKTFDYYPDFSIAPITGGLSGQTVSGDVSVYSVEVKNFPKHILKSLSMDTIDEYASGLGAPGQDPARPLTDGDIIKSKFAQSLFLANEKIIWQDASTAISAPGGILKQIEDASTYTSLGFDDISFATCTDTSILDYMRSATNAVAGSFPEFINNTEVIMAMSPANLYSYKAALTNTAGIKTLESFDYGTIDNFVIPGTGILAVGLPGLNGDNNIVCTHKGNIKVVYDGKGEDDVLTLKYFDGPGSGYGYSWILAGAYRIGAKVVDVTKTLKTI